LSVCECVCVCVCVCVCESDRESVQAKLLANNPDYKLRRNKHT